MEELWSFERVAQYFGVSRRTVNRWLKRGFVQPIRPGGRKAFFRRSEIEQYVGLQRIVNFLSDSRVSITIVTFQVFALPGGQRLLARELTESDSETAPPPDVTPLKRLRAAARSAGIGDAFDALVNAGEQLKLPRRVYKRSVMFSVPSRKYRGLFTVWSTPAKGDRLWVYVFAEAFAEFYGISCAKLKQLLGGTGWIELDAQQARRLGKGLIQLLGDERRDPT